MSKKNGSGPTKDEIQSLIDGFSKQAQEAEKELEAADQALGDWKLAQIESQKQEAVSRGATLPRAPVFLLEVDDPERKHLEYMRTRAVAQVADLQRRIKLLEKAKSMTPN